MHQIVDIAHLFLKIDFVHAEDIYQCMVEVGLDYNVGIISSLPLRYHDETVDDITEVVDGNRVIKDGEVCGTVGGRNRKGIVKVSQQNSPRTILAMHGPTGALVPS